MVLLRSVDNMTTSLISFLTMHHSREFLASKGLNTKTLVDIAFKIVNLIHEKSLQRQLFHLTLEEGTPDIVLHTGVRWLSKYKFLQIFRTLLSEITNF
jgi:hypothetical protein